MEGLMTSKEAADYLGYSEYSLRASRSRGDLSGLKPPKFIKLNKSVRYRKEDLDQWIEDNAEEQE